MINDEYSFEKHKPIMYSILKKYGLYDKREDYIDICYIGYAKGIKKYDSTKSKETTYIYKCIENELLCELRKENAKKRQHKEVSIDYIFDKRGHTLNDLIPSGLDLETDLIAGENNNKLCECMKSLTKAEQIIIKNLFQFGGHNKTQIELAEYFNISQGQISKIKNKCLEKMREMMENER